MFNCLSVQPTHFYLASLTTYNDDLKDRSANTEIESFSSLNSVFIWIRDALLRHYDFFNRDEDDYAD